MPIARNAQQSLALGNLDFVALDQRRSSQHFALSQRKGRVDLWNCRTLIRKTSDHFSDTAYYHSDKTSHRLQLASGLSGCDFLRDAEQFYLRAWDRPSENSFNHAMRRSASLRLLT